MATAELEQDTENVIDVSEQIQSANGENGQDRAARWKQAEHVFATPHPAHELISSETLYQRDVKDKEGNVIEAAPEGFTRYIVSNLVPSNRLSEVERLCKMHSIQIKDEMRFAMLQMVEGLIQNLSSRPVPADYKETATRLSAEEREMKKQILEARKAELQRLAEEGKRIRAEAKATRERINEEFNQKLAEKRGNTIDNPNLKAEAENAVLNGANGTQDVPTPVIENVLSAPVPAPEQPKKTK